MVLVRVGQVVLASQATGMSDMAGMALAVMIPVTPESPVVMSRAATVSTVVLVRVGQVGTTRAARVLNPDRALLHLTPTVRDRAHLDPIPAPPDPDPMQAPPDPMPEADRRWEPTIRAAVPREALTRPADRTRRPEVTPQAEATRPVEVADPKPLSTQVAASAKARS